MCILIPIPIPCLTNKPVGHIHFIRNKCRWQPRTFARLLCRTMHDFVCLKNRKDYLVSYSWTQCNLMVIFTGKVQIYIYLT